MSHGCKERPPGLEAEACSRALSQARVYIEQIRSRVSAGGPDMQSGAKGASLVAKRDYLVDAAKQIRLALDRDVNEDYEAAFNFYKNGVDLLLGGIQVESNKERREAVKRKVAQYLKRAEEIFNSHLQRTLGNGPTATEGYSSLRFRPVRILSSPVENLRMCKVVRVIDKVQLVEDPSTGETFVLKSLPKSHVERRGRQTILPQGVPYMVKLLRYYVSEDSIFLRLQHVQGGKLWSQLRKLLHPGMERGKEYPECSSPFRKTVKLKNSYTAPSMSFSVEQEGCWGHHEAGSQWEGSHEALRTCSASSPDSVFLNPGNGQSPKSNQSGSWNEHTSQSFSQERSADHPVVGQGTHRSSPNCTVCVGPINDIREVAQRQGTRLNAAHPTSLTTNASCLNQREPAKETGPLTSENQDLWSPESQTLVDSFRSLKAKLPSLDLRCPNGGLAREGIPMVDSELRTSPGTVTNPRVGSHPQNPKMVVAQKTLCRAVPAEDNTNEDHHLHEVPFACTETSFTLLTRGIPSILGNGETDPSSMAQECRDTSEGTRGGSHSFNGKEAQKVISGSQGGSLPLKSEQETSQTGDQQDPGPDVHPAREKGIGPALGSPNASPDIEVDGWCFVSAPPLSAAEPGRGAQGAWGLPEDQIRQWAAEILLALEGLHQQGVMCQDLNPRNVLLDDTGHICLTYFAQWPEVEPQFCSRAQEELYTAPEVHGISEVTEACDWWSFGALLYELLTGMSLSQNHPSGIYTHTRLHLPDTLSCAAVSLLTELLQWDPDSRIGSGTDGISQIKSHPFFKNIQWNQLV